MGPVRPGLTKQERKFLMAEPKVAARPRKRPVCRPDDQHLRLRLALDAMLAERAPVTFKTVAERAGLSESAIFRNDPLKEMVHEARLEAFEHARTAAATVTADRLAEPETGSAVADGEPTVSALAAAWLQGRLDRGEIVARSKEVDAGRLAGLVARCGHMPPRQLTREALLRWQATIGHLAPASRRRYVGTVGLFCRWLVDEGYIEHNPAARLVRVREPRRVPRALPSDDVARVLAGTVTARDRLMVWLMVGMGLRCIEVSRLDLADWSETSGTLEVTGKAGHERVLPVPDEVSGALEAYMVERGWRAGPLIVAVGSKGQPDGRLSARWISKRTGRLMAAAGVHRRGDGRSAHALRHTAATDVYARSRDIRLVQGMLGHASLQTTQVYLSRADLGAMRQAMAGRAYAAEVGA